MSHLPSFAQLVAGALLFLLTAPANAQAGAALQSLRALDARVATVGHRLATANAPICGERRWHPGLLIHHRSLYARLDRAALEAAFGLKEDPAVLAVAAGGAADRAGLRPDDVILSVDGAPLPRPGAEVEKSYAPTERIIAAIEAAFADGIGSLVVLRGGSRMKVAVIADQGCASRFQLVPSARQAAKADGTYVQLTSAFVEYTRDEDELAAVVAHEMAHNILRHRIRLNAAGVDRGWRASFGRNGRLFRQVEMEADRLAVHLMERAGYDPTGAVRLWTRQGAQDNSLIEGTHPAWATRIKAMEAEIAVIAAAKARGEQAPVPLVAGGAGAS